MLSNTSQGTQYRKCKLASTSTEKIYTEGYFLDKCQHSYILSGSVLLNMLSYYRVAIAVVGCIIIYCNDIINSKIVKYFKIL